MDQRRNEYGFRRILTILLLKVRVELSQFVPHELGNAHVQLLGTPGPWHPLDLLGVS